MDKGRICVGPRNTTDKGKYICGWPSEYDTENVSVVSLANTRMAKRTYLEFDQ
jgi:hypothetical protein